MEDVQIEVESILRKCSVEELRAVATEIRVDDVADKSKIQVLRLIGDAIEGLPDDNQKLTAMKRMLPVVPDHIMPLLCSVLTGGRKESSSDEYVAKVVGALAGNNALKRDLKFSGTIDSGTESDMDVVTLNAYVDEARKKGYSEQAIASAVRKCVAQGSDTRTYFDLKPNITLKEMIDFITGAQKATTSRQLYKSISSACQNPNEESQKFAVRLLGLREKLLNAAEKENWVRYNAAQIQEVFLEALRTGISDESVKWRNEPLIVSGTAASERLDQEIVSTLKAIEAEEVIRREKQEQMARISRLAVNEVNIPLPTNTIPSQTPTSSSLEAKLLQKLNENSETMKAMQNTMQSLQNEVNNLKVNKPQGGTKLSKKQFGCDFCVQNNKNSCSHCFLCGAGDHKSFDPNCPKRKGN